VRRAAKTERRSITVCASIAQINIPDSILRIVSFGADLASFLATYCSHFLDTLFADWILDIG
jgi:hypothetical protein